jgi:hypothetical protein
VQQHHARGYEGVQRGLLGRHSSPSLVLLAEKAARAEKCHQFHKLMELQVAVATHAGFLPSPSWLLVPMQGLAYACHRNIDHHVSKFWTDLNLRSRSRTSTPIVGYDFLPPMKEKTDSACLRKVYGCNEQIRRSHEKKRSCTRATRCRQYCTINVTLK